MKSIFISHYSGFGGANFSMISLIEHLQKLNIESYVLLPKKGPIEKLLNDKKIPYSIIKYASLRTVNKGTIRNWTNYQIRKIINKIAAKKIATTLNDKFDIIHANSSLAFIGEELKKMTGKPLVWHLREFGEKDYGFIFPGGVSKARKAYENADALIAISNSIYDYYKTDICHNGNYHIVYNGIDETKYAIHRKIVPQHFVRMCIVGGLSESKNQQELIEAISLMSETNCSLDIIGDGDPNIVLALKKKTKDLGLNNVSFLGERKDIASIISDYDIGIITSKNEAFGRVIIEYKLGGLAVVASNAGACPELVCDGMDGLLYQLGDPQNLAKKLDLLVKDSDFRILLATNGRSSALQRFTAAHNAEEIKKIYSILLCKNPSIS